MEFTIPQSLITEHEELHAELVRATEEGGRVGRAAKAVAKILHPHFLREEEYALPPLGVLQPLARGEGALDVQTVLKMTDRLKQDLGEMLDEHKAIVAQLKELIRASKEESKDRYVRFAEKLILHAQTEEEVLYPASILIGEYLKPRRKGKAATSASEVLPAFTL